MAELVTDKGDIIVGWFPPTPEEEVKEPPKKRVKKEKKD